MIHYLFAAFLGLATQFSVSVKTPDGAKNYNDNQNKDVKIEMPTDRYVCMRRALGQSKNLAMVMVTCEEKGVPAVAFVGVCRMDGPDANISGGTINVAEPGEEPIPITIMINCRTIPTGQVL